MLEHPNIATRNCQHCLTWQYIEDGEKAGTILKNRAGENQKRSHAPLCATGKCPKGSPQTAKEHELSEQNWKAYLAYKTSCSMSFTNLNERERRDPMLQKNMQVIHAIVHPHEQLSIMQAALMPLLMAPAESGRNQHGRTRR